MTQGIDNVVVDASSIEVPRRARRAKTDQLDAAALLPLLGRYRSGERKVWSVVRVPSVEAENARQLEREIEAATGERTRIRNRLQGLLAAEGTVLRINRHFTSALRLARTGDGRPLPPGLRARLAREAEALGVAGNLLIALWRYLETGVEPEGAVLRRGNGAIRAREVGPMCDGQDQLVRAARR